jgi:maleylacetoacetate isomerase
MADEIRLYSYWRSSAAYRVRIALNLKRLDHEVVPVHLTEGGGQQHTPAFREINPQGLIPVLQHGNRIFRQSLAIIEYLDEVFPEPSLIPSLPRERARVLALAQIIACDIHPLCNLRVLQYLEREFGVADVERERWCRHWIEEGFAAIESMLADNPSTGTFCEGDEPGLADICLVPQVYNANRWRVDMGRFPVIQRIYETCMHEEAFDKARPENQADAPEAV